MIIELKKAGFTMKEIMDMTFDQFEYFYRFARVRYFESLANMVLVFHAKPKRLYQDIMRMIRNLEYGKRRDVPFYDKEKFKQFVRHLPGVVVEVKNESGGINGSN